MSLSDTQRIEILILLGCGDKTRTQKQVCEIFNTKYPDRRISQSTVSRIENKFREFGNVTDIPKCGRKRILDDEQKWDILLDIQDNPHKPTRKVAADNDVKLRMLFPDDDNLNEIDRNIWFQQDGAIPHFSLEGLNVGIGRLSSKQLKRMTLSVQKRLCAPLGNVLGLTRVICDGPGRRRWRVGRRVCVMIVGVSQSPVYCTKILSRRPARTVALSGSPFVHVITRTGQVTVVVLQQSADTQQVPHADQIWPQFVHHRLRLRAGVEVELTAEDGREDVKLLMGEVVRGSRHRGGRGGSQSPQTGRYTLEIQLDAALDFF
ncbi:hypothetical protein NQ318_006366 [Aromia moschata]|uniref:DUF4817 domain-containing protein n=1 Tax=Aromia moschata TaxID=1265417 RepID=A0AAV8YKB3_9CUCU|nr:hypothetical protein NQ318_006366 [Aromia moschata]